MSAVLVGGTGYGGAEILRHLLDHPGVAIRCVTAADHVGAALGEVHWTLRGRTELRVEDLAPLDAVAAVDAEVVFLGLPHTVSATLAPGLVDAGVKVVDLSGDFRLHEAEAYARYYGVPHPRPDLLTDGSWVYGSPELNREALRSARNIASPGCFATTMLLSLLPLARAGVLGKVRGVACTGSSGSGVRAAATTHHPIRAANLRTYRQLCHQHTPEIVQSLARAGSPNAAVEWVPVSAPLVRGILATSFVDLPPGWDAQRVYECYRDAYIDEPFVDLLGADERMPEVVSVAGTMRCEVGLRIEGDTIVCVAALDNLVKGGAGQAVQSMNLMLGFPETTGLDAPGLWP